MIHNWECKRCTHQWCTSCMGEMLTKPEDRQNRDRQMASDLCWDCFEQLEAGEIAGLELFDLFFYLQTKARHYGGRRGDERYIGESKYSGMTHPHISGWDKDAKTYDPSKSNWESGRTAEEDQLAEIVRDVENVYLETIFKQRTSKRIELDKYQEGAGFVFFGSQPRPEGFEGDPPGKQRFEVLFGLDMSTGDIVAPYIKVNDGTDSCELPAKEFQLETLTTT